MELGFPLGADTDSSSHSNGNKTQCSNWFPVGADTDCSYHSNGNKTQLSCNGS